MNKTAFTTLALGALALPAAALDADALARDVERSVTLALTDLPQRIALGDGALLFAGRELETGTPVKGAPYCATAVHENVQVLADGNRIVRQQHSRLCRDGEGRTRHEVQREGGPSTVYLNDPVAKTSWILYPDQKRMLRLRATAPHGGTPDPAAHAAWQASMREWGERMKEQAARWREWGGRVAEDARAADAERVRARTLRGEPGVVIERDVVIPATPGASAPQLRRELRVLRASDMPAPPAPMALPVPPVPPMPPLLLPGPLTATLALPREGGATTALPAKEIEGLKVNGERTTWTIAAGKIGNERPIVISREVWRSPELMLTVSSRDADPRSGERNYRLEQVRRGEPDPALMKPPADYSEAPRRSAAPKASEAPRS